MFFYLYCDVLHWLGGEQNIIYKGVKTFLEQMRGKAQKG